MSCVFPDKAFKPDSRRLKWAIFGAMFKNTMAMAPGWCRKKNVNVGRKTLVDRRNNGKDSRKKNVDARMNARERSVSVRKNVKNSVRNNGKTNSVRIFGIIKAAAVEEAALRTPLPDRGGPSIYFRSF